MYMNHQACWALFQMTAFIVPDVQSNDDTSQYDKYADSVEESGPLLNHQKDQEVALITLMTILIPGPSSTFRCGPLVRHTCVSAHNVQLLNAPSSAACSLSQLFGGF